MIVFSELGSWGRFSNQLFEVASTIGIATKNGHDYSFPAWKYSSSFSAPFPKMPQVKYSVLTEEYYHYKEINVDEGNYDLRGYFQSYKYFEHCQRLVKKYFSFSQKFPEMEAVAVHVRRGDYLRFPDHHPVLPMSYYKEAMDRFKGYRFIIFSDDIQWCKDQDWFGHRVAFSEGMSEVTDLNLMSRCEHQIIANSSFSWFGAWLNSNEDKTVIAPSCWFGCKLKHDTKDLIPEGWQIL